MKNNAQFNSDICTVICGSFRKHLQHIVMLKKLIEKNNIAVLSPAGHTSVNPDEEFIILDSDPVSHPKLLQDSVFAKIRRSTFIVIANINGYLGKAAIMEIGYAIAQGITIYTLEQVEDPNLSPYCKPLNELFEEITSAEISYLIDEQNAMFKKHTNLASRKAN